MPNTKLNYESLETRRLLAGHTTDDHSDVADECATPVIVGDQYSGSLVAGDLDVFVIEAIEGQKYQVNSVRNQFPDVRIREQDGSSVIYRSRSVAWTADYTGKYFIELGNRVGFYVFHIDQPFDDRPDRIAHVENIEEPVFRHSGRLEENEDIDVYAVPISANNRYRLSITGESIRLQIIDSDSNEIGSMTTSVSSSIDSSSLQWPTVDFAPTIEDGIYYFAVSNRSPRQNEVTNTRYSIELETSDDDFPDRIATTVPTIELNTLQRGENEISDDRDVFQFDAEADRYYQISDTQNSSTIHLYGENGNLLASRSGGIVRQGAFRWQATDAEKYYIEVRQANTQYEIVVSEVSGLDDDFVDSSNDAIVRDLPFAVSGSLGHTADRDVFAFEVIQGVSYGIIAGYFPFTIVDQQGNRIEVERPLTNPGASEWIADKSETIYVVIDPFLQPPLVIGELVIDFSGELFDYEFGVIRERYDFNGDGQITSADIDELSLAIRSSNYNVLFDLNTDSVVTDEDRNFLLRKLDYLPGDADLNGQVNFADFLKVSAAFGTSAGWEDGDFDGDGVVGFSDFLTLNDNFASSQYKSPQELDELLLNDGIRIDGESEGDQLGFTVSAAGDINGDGLSDVIISASDLSDNELRNQGAVYVVFGHRDTKASINISELDGSDGFRIEGSDNQFLGSSVSSAGDFNGDGFSDLLIGAVGTAPSGAAYIIYGSAKFEPKLNLETLGEAGIVIVGDQRRDQFGLAVADAGDLNQDGFDDVIVGAQSATPGEVSRAGAAYVVYGSDQSSLSINVNSLDDSNGYVISGNTTSSRFGLSLDGVGDFDGDGRDDVVVGAPGEGVSYVFTDSESRITLRNDPDAPDPPSDQGRAVRGIGDVNQDGFSDVAVGASSEYSIVFGGPNRSIPIRGAALGSSLTTLVSFAGPIDLNGDGKDDFLVGNSESAPFTDDGNRDDAGVVSVIFGDNPLGDEFFALPTRVDGKAGVLIHGIAEGDATGRSVDVLGDFNGDGLDDIIIGAHQANDGRGSAYILFGGLL